MIEKRLIALEDGIKEVKLMQSELAKKNAHAQLLIEQMERQLKQYEDSLNSEESPKVDHSVLLNTHGFMKQPKEVGSSHELLSSTLTL